MKIMIKSSLFALAFVALAGCSSPPKEKHLTHARMKKPAVQSDESRSLVAGPVEAFGMNLPFRSHVLSETPDSAVVEVPFPFYQVIEYVRARVEAKSERGDAKTMTFEGASFEGAPEGQRFDLVITRTGQTAKVLFVRSTNDDKPFAGKRPRLALGKNERPISVGDGPASF
jgi:hypothetical protein